MFGRMVGLHLLVGLSCSEPRVHRSGQSTELPRRFLPSLWDDEVRVYRHAYTTSRSGVRCFGLIQEFNVNDCDSRALGPSGARAQRLLVCHRQGESGYSFWR